MGDWRKYYNEERPPGAIGQMTPIMLPNHESAVKISEVSDFRTETSVFKSSNLPENTVSNGVSLQIGFVIPCVGNESKRGRHEATRAS